MSDFGGSVVGLVIHNMLTRRALDFVRMIFKVCLGLR